MPTAVTDPYFTAAEYRDRVGKSDATSDATILLQATAISRYFDLRLHRFFTQDAAVVARTFDGNGDDILWLPADIATTTGLVVKVDLNEDYLFTGATETLTLNTHFWVGPSDAEKGPEPRPFTNLQVIPNNGVLDRWPLQLRAVQVTAKFGWPAVPAAIKEAAISVTRQLRDILGSGVTMTMESIDAAIQSSPTTMALILDIERMYARPLTGSC